MKHRKWLGLLAIMPASAIIYIDQSVLPVALPTIEKHLNATTMELWWCVNAYLLVSAVLLLVGGKTGDRIGHRSAFLWGMVVFALSSALCGLSFNASWLIGARALQGIGAALMIPTTAPIIMSLFPQSQRGKAIGVNVSISSLFLVSAPLIGGYLTQALSWRWIFWINLPLAVLGVVLVLLFVPASRTTKDHHKFDPLGFFLFLISSSSLVIWIMQGTEWGWSSLMSMTFLVLALAAGFFFFLREKKADHPLIDLSLFRHPIYKAVNISLFATQFILMITVYRAVFFQDAFGWSALQSGTIFFMTSLPLLFMSLVGGWLADRYGSKTPIALGFILLIFSFLWLAFFVETSLPLLVLGFFAFNCGIPLIFTPSYSSAMGAIPPTKAGVAFGILATVRALSASFGVAAISSFTEYVKLTSFTTLLQSNPITKNLNPLFMHNLNLNEYPNTQQLKTVLAYLKKAQIDGFFSIHLALAFLLIIALAFVFVLYHRRPTHQPPNTPAEGWD